MKIAYFCVVTAAMKDVLKEKEIKRFDKKAWHISVPCWKWIYSQGWFMLVWFCSCYWYEL